MTPEWAMVFLTAIYVVATISYVVVAFRTLGRMKQQAEFMGEQVEIAREGAAAAKASAEAALRSIELARENAERELRAYVCVDNAEIKFTYGVPEGTVIFKNFGQTPAYDVRTWIHTWNWMHPLTIPLPEPPPNFPMATNILAPGAFEIMPIPPKPPIPEEHLNSEVGTKTWTIYVYGKVTYRDAFSKDRHTKFRLMYGGTEGVPGKDFTSGTLLLVPDSEGNEST